MTTVEYPPWMRHPGTCSHPPRDPEHLAMVASHYGGRDTIQLTTALAPPPGQAGATFVWAWAMPLFWLWHRHERKQIREVAATLLGVPLAPLNLLVLTSRRLRFWQLTREGRGRRATYVVGEHLGELDRSSVAAITNNSAGEGWRTCTIHLADGTSLDVRVPAQRVAALVAAFPQA